MEDTLKTQEAPPLLSTTTTTELRTRRDDLVSQIQTESSNMRVRLTACNNYKRVLSKVLDQDTLSLSRLEQEVQKDLQELEGEILEGNVVPDELIRTVQQRNGVMRLKNEDGKEILGSLLGTTFAAAREEQASLARVKKIQEELNLIKVELDKREEGDSSD